MSREQPESGREARRVLDADARYFLHQAASTPGLSAVRRAEGIWVEDLDGCRFMDFHGNRVHHLGYAHRTLVEPSRRGWTTSPSRPAGSRTTSPSPWPGGSRSWPRSRSARSCSPTEPELEQAFAILDTCLDEVEVAGTG
jgi:hypothetical protein